MAKRKKAEAKEVESNGKTRFELRFSDALFHRLKKSADDADISMNQLMQGIAEWASRHLQVGEPERDETGVIGVKKIPGVVFIGELGSVLSRQEREEAAYEGRCDIEEVPQYVPGKVYVTLDFTERRVVREDDEAIQQ